jgi:small-conductance mechanosensitive channel
MKFLIYQLLVQCLSKLNEISASLTRIEAKENTILMDETQALALLGKIDTATTKAASGITALGTTAQGINDGLDVILAKLAALPPDTVPADIIAGLQAEADKSQAVADSTDALATALAAIASKEAGATTTNPVPVPVPDPTPAPDPGQTPTV